MTVGSIGGAVAAASSLFRFGFRPAFPSDGGPLMSIAGGDEGQDAADSAPDPEQESVFRAVEVALREAGYLDA